MSALAELSQLIFPSRCFACHHLGPSICSACRSSWHPHYYKTKIDSLTVHSALLYTPTASKIQLSRRVLDQSGLHRDERASNLAGAFSLNSSARGELILIDDVVTTGATLREAARAVNSQGFQAVGSVTAITACVAQPLR